MLRTFTRYLYGSILQSLQLSAFLAAGPEEHAGIAGYLVLHLLYGPALVIYGPLKLINPVKQKLYHVVFPVQLT